MTARRRPGVYLDMWPLGEALERFLAAVARAAMPGPERVTTHSALGRVTAEAVFAANSSPHYLAAAMDGFAVRSALTAGACEGAPARLRIPDEARPVNTGDAIPQGFDAVCKVEDAQQPGESIVEMRQPLAPGTHVRSIGEDVSAGELLLPPGHTIGPADVGCLLGAGVLEVAARRRPRVAILPTGSELVRPGAALAPGDVVEYNSAMLAAMVSEWGGAPCTADNVEDDPESLWRAVEGLLEGCELLAVIGGSSAGCADFVPQVIRDHGELLVHGVRIQPGKPVALGAIGGKPVIGVPGYPVSAWTAFDLFAKPAIFRMLGVRPPRRERISVRVKRKIPSRAGVLEFVRANVGEVGGEWVALPLKRGAGVISSLMRATALLCVPEASEGVDAGQQVEAELLVGLEELRGDILGAGDAHPSLDCLSAALAAPYPPTSLRWIGAGAEAGLLALKRGEAHVAGVTGFDAPTGRGILGDIGLAVVRVASAAPHAAFDLVIPDAYRETARLRRLIEILRSDVFRDQLAALGYDPSATGEVVYEQ
jgi:putative molybdopterin biosynthesis protein